ncbi:MAG TPA: SusC/RagA family TonB-linked outer membrane protein [Chitinophagaceae bacterium]|nr:SusC/RagA family TonB-linked outer membrane protein [Chitinophagaceae bacterium]
MTTTRNNLRAVCLSALFLLVTHLALAQSRVVTGKVTDTRDGSAIPGATVTVTATAGIATTTDASGVFSLSVPASARSLTISAVGFGTQEVPLGESNTYNVPLQYGVKSMEDVVVVGYGTQRRREVTSATDRVTADEFRQSGARNPLDLIQGKVAGLQIRRSSSNPNSGVGVQIRGVTSLTADQSPLIVIDGIPGGNLDLIQQEDIESIDVLKDGSAAAIYGTTANGGVILITTKKGKAGPPRFDYATYLRRETLRERPGFLTPEEFKAKLASGELNPSNYTNYGNTTDFFDALINHKNLTQYHTLAMSGGSVTSNYRASIYYRDIEGFALENGRREYGGRLNFNQRGLNDMLTAQFNLATNFNNANLLGGGGWEDQLTKNPTLPHKNPDGTWYFEGTSTNQLARLHQETNRRQQQTSSLDGRITLEPIKGLRGTLAGSIQRDAFVDGAYRSLASEFSVENQQGGGYASRNTGLRMDYAFEPTIEYARTVAADHSVTAITGYSYRYTVNEGFNANNYGFVNDIFEENNLGTGNQLGLGKAGLGSFKNDNTLIAFFGRVNYAYKGKYLAQFILRHEGSSRFGRNYKWGNFPAVSAGWNISQEDFMDNVTFVNNLKLRVGYGVTGNQNIPNYSSLVTMGGGGFYRYPDGQYRETYGPNRNPNPDLRWEKKKELNIGVDFSLLQNRLTGALEVFDRTVEDLLQTYPSPQPSFVRESIYTNVGTVTARGVELALSYAAIRSKDFNWNTDLTASTTKSKLHQLSNDVFKLNLLTAGGIGGFGALGNASRLYVGREIGEFWGKRFAGFTPDGKWLFYNKKGEMVPNDQINTSSDITQTDFAVLGNAIPKLYLSWTNDFSYKGFDLRFYLRGKFGHDILNTMALSYGNKVTKTNLLRSAFDKYAVINDTYMYSDYYIEPGDFVKLDEVTFGYNFRMNNRYVRTLRLYLTGQNLATFTKYTGNDPDFVNDLGFGAGVDERGPYPSTRSFLVGLNLGF